jgi:hypothetical protein
MAMVAAIHKIIHGWCELPVGGVILGGDTDRNHNGTKFSIPVSATPFILKILYMLVLGLC